ncbi:copper resistance protein CopC [Nonomuraea sp. B12E4]|uniref:copper resistance CopC family protein n=1 Tax=Nonomuraea sp. B12E4 TaxID=3153564 RepID=UPI00325CDB5C
MTFPQRSIRKAALAVLACALFLALPASPALAHDALKRSSPARNARVASVGQIELEFSAGVKFPFVLLHDAAGKRIAIGEPRTSGHLVLAEVPQPLAPGAYVIAWRVVSSDGHPIEGEIPFSVKGSPSAPASSSPAGGAATGEPSPAAAVPTPAAAGSAAAAETSASAGVPGWIWGGLAVLVVLGAFVLIRTARRGPDREDVDAD